MAWTERQGDAVRLGRRALFSLTNGYGAEALSRPAARWRGLFGTAAFSVQKLTPSLIERELTFAALYSAATLTQPTFATAPTVA